MIIAHPNYVSMRNPLLCVMQLNYKHIQAALWKKVTRFFTWASLHHSKESREASFRTCQGVVTYAPPVEAFATGIKIGSNDQRYFSDRSSDHSHFHERSRIKKACRDVTIRQRTRTYARARTRVPAWRVS